MVGSPWSLEYFFLPQKWQNVIDGYKRSRNLGNRLCGLMHQYQNLSTNNCEKVFSPINRNVCFSADSYVADEIITSAAGVRVRVGNTDAEGRMAMADPLHHTAVQVPNSLCSYHGKSLNLPQYRKAPFELSPCHNYKVLVVPPPRISPHHRSWRRP